MGQNPGGASTYTPNVVAVVDPVTGGPGPYVYRKLSANDVTATAIKDAGATPGRAFRIVAQNANAAVRFIKLYDKATAPTVGTDTPVMTVAIPASNVPLVIDLGDMGVAFTLGMWLGTTTGVADNNTGAPAADELITQIVYA